MRSLRLALVVGALALLAAVYPWPYGYYVFLRFLICGVATFGAYVALRQRSPLAFPFLAAGILFNPIVPAHMTRAIWIGVDVVVATGFLVTARLAARLDPVPVSFPRSGPGQVPATRASG
jgi:hypothetical protein